MEKKTRRRILSLQGYYFLSFFGIGSLAPLLGVYLTDVEKLSGTQIGTILSIGPIIMIFFQPIWGMLTDATNAPAKVLAIATGLTGILGFGYLAFHQYSLIIVSAIFIAIFQSAMIPVSDSISITYAAKHDYHYGNIRMYGSLGFGLAVFILGRLSEQTPTIIFYAFSVTLLLGALISLLLPKGEEGMEKTGLLSGVKELFSLRKFILFLFITFLFFGPNLANNFYFGLFVHESGGSYTGIGIAFLIAVLSEVPIMKISGKWIQKYGLLQVAIFAGLISMVRWFFNFLQPSLPLVYVSAVVQGLSIGLFIPAGLQYVKEITPIHISATAVTIYAAIGNGLGNWFATFLAGIIYDKYSIFASYLFFAIMAFGGVLLNLWLLKMEKGRLPLKKTA